MINKEQIETIIAEAEDEIKKFGRTSLKVSIDMINALEQVKSINYDAVLAIDACGEQGYADCTHWQNSSKGCNGCKKTFKKHL